MNSRQLFRKATIVALCLICLFLFSTHSAANGNTRHEAEYSGSTHAPKTDYRLYLPLSVKGAPTVSAPLPDQYVFVENWTHQHGFGNCPGPCIDFPGYSFNPSSGELFVFFPPKLGSEDIGYIGNGTALSGSAGCGVSSRVWSFAQLPADQGGISLKSVDSMGRVWIEKAEVTVSLMPGETWSNATVITNTNCVITTTVSLSNHGFLERNKIQYIR